LATVTKLKHFLVVILQFPIFLQIILIKLQFWKIYIRTKLKDFIANATCCYHFVSTWSCLSSHCWKWEVEGIKITCILMVCCSCSLKWNVNFKKISFSNNIQTFKTKSSVISAYSVGPWYHRMVHLRVMDEADGLQTCRVGVNILNKQLQIGTKWSSSCLGFGWGANNSSP
jgi:hypothetical protein